MAMLVFMHSSLDKATISAPTENCSKSQTLVVESSTPSVVPNINQVVEILEIATGHRVASSIWEGHGLKVKSCAAM